MNDDTIYLSEEDYNELITKLDKEPDINVKLKELFKRGTWRENGKR